MIAGTAERIKGGNFTPPLLDDFNKLACYPFTMACLLAHTAINGSANSVDIREKIYELAGEGAITRPLDPAYIFGSRMLLHELDMLEVDGAKPLSTKINAGSIRRGLPLVGVFGGWRCDISPDLNVRPLLDIIEHGSDWTIYKRLKFIHLLVKAEGAVYNSALPDLIGVGRSNFLAQTKTLEAAGLITRNRVRQHDARLGIKIDLTDEFREPATRLVTQFAGLWTPAGRKRAAARAHSILENPNEFAQLVNTGIAPRKRTGLAKQYKGTRKELPSLAPPAKERPKPLVEIDPRTVTVLNQLGGSPAAMAHLLAHCRLPSAWLTRDAALQIIGKRWNQDERYPSHPRLPTAQAKLIELDMLVERNHRLETHLSPLGVLEGVPIISTLVNWWAALPPEACSRKLIVPKAYTLGKKIAALTIFLNYEHESAQKLRNEGELTEDNRHIIGRLEAAGIIKSHKLDNVLKHLRIVEYERPLIVDLVTQLAALKDEESATQATRNAITLARSDTILSRLSVLR